MQTSVKPAPEPSLIAGDCSHHLEHPSTRVRLRLSGGFGIQDSFTPFASAVVRDYRRQSARLLKLLAMAARGTGPPQLSA